MRPTSGRASGRTTSFEVALTAAADPGAPHGGRRGVSGSSPWAPKPCAVPPPPTSDHHRPFGGDRFGVLAERFAQFFGTPQFIISQTVIIVIWIALNAAVVAFRWDPYPF